MAAPARWGAAQPAQDPRPAASTQVFEALADHAYGDSSTVQVIRPAAVLSETAARTILVELLMQDARDGGRWLAEATQWRRYDQPWTGHGEPGAAILIGSLQVVYDRPRRYEITVFRATVTAQGHEVGWTTQSLCDEAFGHAGLTLASCPRADLAAPPVRFRMR